jgi:hypothetical protein
LQNNRVYSAASLTDVINLLKQHRLSGLLTIRPASDPYKEEARITVELGRPVYIRQGLHEENVTDVALSGLNGWGMIYFTFQAIEPTLQLPPPHTPSIPRTAESPALHTRPRFSSAVTRPLPTITPQMIRDQAGTYNTQPSGSNRGASLPNTPFPGTQSSKNPPPDYSSNLLFDEPIPTLALEMAIASITSTGRDYPIARIPRYDRTIYLLINGRRTIADLAHLTKRTIEEVCNSLYRLKEQELIVIRI